MNDKASSPNETGSHRYCAGIPVWFTRILKDGATGHPAIVVEVEIGEKVEVPVIKPEVPDGIVVAINGVEETPVWDNSVPIKPVLDTVGEAIVVDDVDEAPLIATAKALT